MQEKISQLAKGRTGKTLVEVLENIKREIADIRTPLKIRKEIENEVRLGIIEALDVFLVEKLKIASGELNPPSADDYN